MLKKETLEEIKKYVHPFRITKGKAFRLKDFDPGDTCGLKLDKGEAAEILQRGIALLAEEQDMLYAQDRWSLLLVFQAMDAAGKDSTSCRASILRAARYSRSSSPRRKSSTTILCGATSDTSPSADASASSTAHTTKKSSSCAYMPRY